MMGLGTAGVGLFVGSDSIDLMSGDNLDAFGNDLGQQLSAQDQQALQSLEQAMSGAPATPVTGGSAMPQAAPTGGVTRAGIPTSL